MNLNTKNVKNILIAAVTMLVATFGNAAPMTDRLLCHDANLTGEASVIVSIQVGIGPVFKDEQSEFRKLALGQRITIGRFPGHTQNVKAFIAKNINPNIQMEFGLLEDSQMGGDGMSPVQAKYNLSKDGSSTVNFNLYEADKTLVASLIQRTGGRTLPNLLKCEIVNF